MQGKPLIMLALAGTLGLGAMFMTKMMLNKQSTAEVSMREVVVAARDFNAEEIIRPDMVKVERMAESAVPAGAFVAADDVAERWVKTAVLEGEPIIERKLGPKGSPPGLVASIPKGMRAFAVDVNEQSGVSGFILPGHHVDVIKFESGDKKMIRGETILQNVLVLAAGQVFVKSDEKSLQSRTVTIAVTPDDADVLVAAKALGTLSLSLRGVNDHDVVERPRRADLVEEGEAKRRGLENQIAELQRDREAKAKEVEAHRRDLEAERRQSAEREKELAKRDLDLKTQTELASEQARESARLKHDLAVMEGKIRANTMGPVGYVYKLPGATPDVYSLRRRNSDPTPRTLPPLRPETPDDSEGSPGTSPARLVPRDLAATSWKPRP